MSKLSRESAYQENNWSQREPCSVNVLCQYTNGFHCLPTEQGPEVELHSCPFTTGLSAPVTGSSQNSCTQLPQGWQGLRKVQTGDIEVGCGSSYCWSVQDSKRRTKFKSRLKYCKIMGCSHKIISWSSKNPMRLIDSLFSAMAGWKVMNLDNLSKLVLHLILNQEMDPFFGSLWSR